MKRLIWSLALALSLGAFSSVAQNKDRKAEGDPKVAQGVSWQGQVVRATGAGAPDIKAATAAQARLGAERAALSDALRNLVAQVKGISVDGSKKMGDLMEKDEIRTRVEGLVRGYKIVGKRYFSDNGVEVDIEVPLALLTDVVDPDATPTQVYGQAPAAAPAPTPAVDPKKPDAKPAVAAAPAPAPSTNTGLVIDARGLKAVPALAPKVFDEAGKAVYTVDSLSAEARKAAGVASYVQSLEDAQKSMKAGDKPLIVKAAKANGAELTLGAEDAKKLAAMNTSFLSEGKVVIVLN